VSSLDQKDPTTAVTHRAPSTKGSRGPSGENALRDHPRREIILGLSAGGLFLLVLIGGGMWAHLDSGVSAPGQIVVSGNRQAVQYRDQGIVSKLEVHEGDSVKAGQVLLQLNADELRASERADAAQTIGLKALQARLMAELLGRASIQFPAEFSAMTGDDRTDADAAIALQTREFVTRNAALSTEKDVLLQKQKESAEQITGLKRQVDANQQQQDLIQQEIGGLKGLFARGLVPATRVRSLQRNAAELQGNKGQYSANIASTQEEIGESRIRISDLERERAADDGKEYQAAQFQISDVEPKLAAVRQQIARTVVRAPVTGRIVGLTIFTVGGVVAPGQKLMDVIPENEPLVIEARVKPADVSDLKVGQQTQIRITGFHERGMPFLHGVVSKISADTLTDEKTGTSYFQIEVTVPPTERDLIRQVRGAEQGLMPGLPVEVVIPLHPRTALDYLFEPLHQMLWKSFRQP
jgi:HlyD family type I secretion membrane fusion protein